MKPLYIRLQHCNSFPFSQTSPASNSTSSDISAQKVRRSEKKSEMKREREADPVEALEMANCLMLLSKVGESDSMAKTQRNRMFACKTCNREFPSFQALGGHRASHKKPRLTAGDILNQADSPAKPKTHECSICGLEFAIGQALGGHMRRHRASPSEGSVEQAIPVMKKSVGGKRVFGVDLNLTPVELDLSLRLVSPMVGCFN